MALLGQIPSPVPQTVPPRNPYLVRSYHIKKNTDGWKSLYILSCLPHVRAHGACFQPQDSKGSCLRSLLAFPSTLLRKSSRIWRLLFVNHQVIRTSCWGKRACGSRTRNSFAAAALILWPTWVSWRVSISEGLLLLECILLFPSLTLNHAQDISLDLCSLDKLCEMVSVSWMYGWHKMSP